MDTQGVDKAVVSVTTPATQPLAPAEAVAIAREANDQAAAAVAAHPDRLAAFATLPTPDPEAAADELERSVTQLGLRGAMLRGNVAVTPSAMFDQRLLRRAIEVLGVDRILMSTDYPFQDAPKRNARAFLASSDLTIDDQERIGSRNAARLLGM
jgi:predicted TIM-barrel fold metal-dependent hydrolase